MSIEVAKTAGFCFGVNRAVQMVYDLIEAGESICTLGPIIHNPLCGCHLSVCGEDPPDRSPGLWP